jgi:benzoyl-CoA reductase subunit D
MARLIGWRVWLARRNDKIRQRDPFKLAESAFDGVLQDAGLERDEVHYVATTGDGEMTSQCASGSGQFLENIARYLGIAQSEIGKLSQQADEPEAVSTICAVLAETDVINMVSRGISAANIVKGIHLAMAGRLSKLLRVIKAGGGVTLVTGGLALDEGLLAALQESVQEQKIKVTVKSHPDSPYAGAIGAALWGAFRYDKLAAEGKFAKAS